MKEYKKPLPRVTALDAPFWEALKNHELRLQKCLDCGSIWYPPAVICPQCLSERYEWSKMSGRGKIWSWANFHKGYFPGFAEDLPYNVVGVRLDEGPLLMTNIVGVKGQDMRCEMRVEAFFDEVTPEVTLLKFKPIT